MHRIFHKETALFTRAFRTMLDIDFPELQSVDIVDSDLTDASVLERHVDTVFLIETAAGKHVLALESQTWDKKEKRSSWPFYVAALYNKYDADVTLLIVTPERATASWARKPIRIGLPEHPTMIVQPLVLGPDNVPPVRTTEQAASDVVLAVFSAITHRKSDHIDRILYALAHALDSISPETGRELAELTAVGLSESAGQQIWRELMATRFKTRTFFDDWRDEARAEVRAEARAEVRAEALAEGESMGEAKGEANALLAVLAARGIDVPDDAHARITSCTDVEQISTWVRNAVTASSIDEVFA